ncbi:MAG: hypothetical protein O3A00_09100 [Planctomycetota bacterium]|nr:hypothetical protein [Planctomycetota bacterium]
MVDAISKHCVPVAIPGGNSLTVRTARGKVLGAPQPGWNSEFGPAMAEFARLADAEKHPTGLQRQTDEPIRGRVPPGVIALRVYIRNLERNGIDDLTRNAYHSKQYKGPQRDFLWLAQHEWQSMVPRNREVGTIQLVPDEIAKRIFKFYFVDSTVGFCPLWDDEDIRQGELSLTVTRADQHGIRLQLRGSVVLSDEADLSISPRKARFQVFGFVDVDGAGAIQRFDVVALGDWFNSQRREYYAKRGLLESTTLGLFFELADPKSLGYGVPPSAIRNGNDEAYVKYFGKPRTELATTSVAISANENPLSSNSSRTATEPLSNEKVQPEECAQCQITPVDTSLVPTESDAAVTTPQLIVDPRAPVADEESTTLWLMLLLLAIVVLLAAGAFYGLQHRPDVQIYGNHIP